MPDKSTGDLFTSSATSKIVNGKSLNKEQISVPCERRPIPKNRGGARSDRATGVNPGGGGGWGMYPTFWLGGWPVQIYPPPPLFEDKIT